VGLTIPHSKTKLFVTKVEQKKKLDGLNDDGRKETGDTERRWGELVADRDIQREDGESWWQIGRNGRTFFDRPNTQWAVVLMEEEEESGS
jgi:hypothetical protein